MLHLNDCNMMKGKLFLVSYICMCYIIFEVVYLIANKKNYISKLLFLILLLVGGTNSNTIFFFFVGGSKDVKTIFIS